MKWYILSTKAGDEQKLKLAIERLIAEQGMQDSFGEILIPEVEREEKKDGKIKIVKKNFYPGYLFIQMNFTEEALLLVKSVPFARKPLFVGEMKRYQGLKQKGWTVPQAVSEVEIQNMKKRLEEGAVSDSATTMYEKGETILIKDGPFAGFKALIDDVKEGKEKLEVLVNIFGRSTPVELNFSQVEKVED